MASIYVYESGDELSVGLQGCDSCNEAIEAAEECADRLGEKIELYDDDGRWLVHPVSVDGEREPADFLGEIPSEKTALRAINRSSAYDEIETLKVGSRAEQAQMVEILEGLVASGEETDSVENGEVTEVWAFDPKSGNDSMTWRVHVRVVR